MTVQISVNLIKAGLKDLCYKNEECREYCKMYLDVEKWGKVHTESLLSTLSSLLLRPQCTVAVAECFPALLLQLMSQSFYGNDCTDMCLHKLKCIALGKLVTLHDDAVKFSLEYFSKNPPPFHPCKCDQVSEPVPKKKRLIKYHVTNYDLVLATYNFISVSCNHWRKHWRWSTFVEYLWDSDEVVCWLSCHIIATLSGMAYSQRLTFISNFVTDDEGCKYSLNFDRSRNIKCKEVEFVQAASVSDGVTDELVSLASPLVVSVAGILLPVFDSTQVGTGNLVLVPSTLTNLRSLALAVAAGKAVCLEGPVGCGKTALVEHLAIVTGRCKSPNFIKVQLGDQTDSKMLLGTYRCTDVPGEFIWQPGVLTQALIGGNWILLEDIDSAPTDVITILASLMETGSISVPGYRDSVAASPGFQLFTTQRLIQGNIGGMHKQQVGGISPMEKLWVKVCMEPLSYQELVHVVKAMYPVLRTIATRIMDAFLLFSAGRHNTSLQSYHAVEETENENGSKGNECEKSVQPRLLGGRLTSTRDLIKWCARIVTGYDVSSQESSLNVLANALDVFCCSTCDPSWRMELAANVAACLGIIRTKAEYLCQSNKPTVSSTQEYLCVGRAKMMRLVNTDAPAHINTNIVSQSSFSLTRQTCQLLERVGVCVTRGEAVLLVGETGTGKTSIIQFLSKQLHTHLVVLNMNQQSDSADLLGGYKPVDMKIIVAPLKEKFEVMFVKTFSRKQNIKFLGHISICFQNCNWKTLLKLMKHSSQAGVKRVCEDNKEKENLVTKEEWLDLIEQIDKLELQLKNSALVFSFIEGSLVKALREGWWVLLDEINLATGETLECLSGLLEGNGDVGRGSLCLHERGDTTPIARHPNFRLFACMNPATDVGKKDLPSGLRNRFTEFYVDELTDKSDLMMLAGNYLSTYAVPSSVLENIIFFYLKVRKEAALSLCDGIGHKPHYSLRTLCRALSVAARNPCGAYIRSLYESFSLGFLTQLDRKSHPVVEAMISKALFRGENKSSVVRKSLPEPIPLGSHICIEVYWISRGSLEPQVPKRYIITPSVRQNLKDLARVVSLSKGTQPCLLQGETSVGKTSLIEFLAASTGNVVLRVNNHEHTDLQEYVGAYTADAETGKMVFTEGVLVEAMRKGYWIILDELNLAPSDVLEALNRVLDDNRELYITETQEVVKAHPHFMLFATQNPPGHYGGRKMLSRAFRNRFVELHFAEIPPEELRTILEMRCDMPPSYSKKLVTVMTDLQVHRRGSAMFAGKQGFITLRDLFRWGERYRLAQTPQGQSNFYDWDLHLAHEGYLLLAGRVRKEEERVVIANTIKKHLNRAVNPEVLFTLNGETSPVTRAVLEELLLTTPPEGFRHLVWTQNMRRQAVLLAKSFQFNEPVLLVGETGIGKTTVCQLLAKHRGQSLRSVNCHMHTEGADFLGGLRPVREKKPDQGENETKRLFEWVDGPLVKAMQKGDIFLADEISLADDSVLERLNSLLEPERKLLLAEKGGGVSGAKAAVLIAHEKFHFVGTMNPGGDFGKKELSPALRNRFTEIWCEGCKDRNDLMCLIEENIECGLSLANQEDATSGIGHIILDFMAWFSSTDIGKRFTISFRDYLNWINFINLTTKKASAGDHKRSTSPSSGPKLNLPNAIVHGACITFLDSLGSGISCSEKESSVHSFHETAVRYLVNLVQRCSGVQLDADAFLSKYSMNFQILSTKFGSEPFFIPAGGELMNQYSGTMQHFAFGAPTSGRNALRICRALQIPGRPILLEGSPGMGKTALVSALANKASHRLVRINLSEQTDVSDLFGADLPVEGGEGGQFSWKDGPFLQALKAGSWILLDELNLASQSVLEGLNAVLDHRGEVFIPELGRSFSIQKDTTCIFACQNPLNQGGARRGLPRSFLNRFTQVFIDPLTSDDFEFILSSAFPTAPSDLISRAVRFNACLVQEIQVQRLWGQRGAPWEFNLRDLIRWFEAMDHHFDFSKKYGSGPEWDPGKFVGLLYVDRMRMPGDKEKVKFLYNEAFSGSIYKPPSWGPPRVRVDRDSLLFGDVTLMRLFAESLTSPLAHNAHPLPDQLLLHRCSNALRSLAVCVQMKWLPILVGGIGSGKTSLVQLLAHLTGNELRIMPVNSSMDTTEILGGFEQTDYNRQFDVIAEKSERLVMHCLRKHLLSSTNRDANMAVKFPVTANLLHHWEEFQIVCNDSINVQSKYQEKEVLDNKIVSLLAAVETTEKPYGKRTSSRVRSLAQDLNILLTTVRQSAGIVKPEYKERYAALAHSWQRLIKSEGDNPDDSESSRILDFLWGVKHEENVQGPEGNESNKISSIKVLHKRLKALKEVLLVLEYHHIAKVSSESRLLMLELKKLESCILGRCGKLTNSGTFEWVDSNLVKCLKDGCWLLVENVNLCSSAVLDRLNALLEPNGTLTIGERGVMHNEVPTITPHPDFRMFFTLDPRHGQISRAMRNRGVEIFLMSPDEGNDYDNMDKRSLLTEAGVKSISLQSKILGVHEVMSSTIIGPEKPSTPQLLHLAFLLAQQLAHSSGTFSSMIESLRSASCDVYVRSQKSSLETKKVAMATLNQVLCSISNVSSLQSDVKDIFENTIQMYLESTCTEVPEWQMTLHCSDLEMDTFGAVSWQRSVPLQVLLSTISAENGVFSFPGGFSPCHTKERKVPVIKLPSTSFWRSGLDEGSLCPDRLPGLKLIPCLVLAYYSSASAEEVNSRHENILYICRNLEKNIKSLVTLLSEKISKMVMSFPSRPSKPWDPRWWNTREDVDGNVNAWALLMELEACCVIEDKALDGSPWFVKEENMKTCCLILKELSENMKNGATMEVSQLDNPVQPILAKFVSLCQQLHAVVYSALHRYSGSVSNWEVLWQAFHWRVRFVALSMLPVCSIVKTDRSAQVEDLLWVHIKWLLKYVARPLAWIGPNSEMQCLLVELTENLLELEKSQMKASDQVVHFAKKVGEQLGWPLPYRRKEEAVLARDIERLEKAICYDSYNSNMLHSNLYLLLTPNGKICHLKLISAYSKLALKETAEAVEVTKTVTENFKSLGFSQTPDGWLCVNHTKTSYNEIIKMAVPLEAHMWPITEFYLLTMNALLKRLLLTTYTDIFHFQKKILSFRQDSDDAIEEVNLNDMNRFVDVNYLQNVASSLYFAIHSSPSAPPKMVASTKMICNDLSTILNGGCLAVKDLLFHMHDFLVSSVLKEEYSVLRTNPQKWTRLEDSPVQHEDSEFFNFQSNNEREESLHFHCPVLSTTVISFVMNDEDSGKDILKTVPLHSHIKRKKQLKTVLEMLWKNQGTFCLKDFDYRLNDAKSAGASVSAILQIASASLRTTSSTDDKWESMLSLFIYNLEEKNCLLMKSLKTCEEDSGGETALVFLTGACWCLYGGLCILLTAASGLFDPSLKRDIKIHYYTQELEEIQLALYTHDMHSKLEVGLQLNDLSSHSALHPTLLWLKNRELFLQKKLKSLSERIAARPSPSKFYELSKALYNFVTRIGSPETINNLHKKLSDAMKSLWDTKKEDVSYNIRVSDAMKALDEAFSWRISLSQFSQQLSQKFGPWYHEMINPVIGGIHQMLHGISLQSSILKKTILLNKNRTLYALISAQPTYLDQFMCKLVCFPTVGARQTLSDLASLCASKNTFILLEAVFDASSFTPKQKEQLVKKQTLSLTMAALEEVKNEIAVRKTISRKLNSWDVLMKVLWRIVRSWKKDLESSKLRKAEEESLYTTRCSTRPGVDDDNIDPAALSLAFPDYKTDFEDLEPASLNSDSFSPTKHGEMDDISEKDDFILFGIDDMNRVAEIHSALLTTLTKANWISSEIPSDLALKEKVNYLEPLLERYGVFSHLLSCLGPALSSGMDRALCHSLTMLTSIAIQESKGSTGDMERVKMTHSKPKKTSSPQTNIKEHPDFYHEPWIEESVRCLPVLNDLKTEVQQLLLNWPEHPVLCQMCTVVDRILSFPPSSPLSRFATGLELTLAKAQEWESNAHSGISLCHNLSQLTSLIIDWRKLELNCWKDCLNSSAQMVRTGASKWWFHLFRLVHSYVKPEGYNSGQPQKGELKATESGELLSLLKQFLEDSPIGEFEVRLNLLYVFHCHSVYMEPGERQGELQNIFWNVYKFYSQFNMQVGAYLQKLRNPIEKKLKEYVKIARWNDISYWSVKETISKAHRTLHKYVRDFEKILQLPVSSALVNTKEKITEEKTKTENFQGGDHERKESYIQAFHDDLTNYLSETKVEAIIKPYDVVQNMLMHQAGHYFNRARRLCKEIISSFNYPDLIEAVDSLTGEVIESAAYLGSLQVPVGLLKEKQKSAAKNILQRKRRALADLFRILTQLGLSYRTGLVLAEKHGNMRESISSSLEMFLIPPIDLKAAINQLESRKADAQLVKMWDGCEAYFVHSMAQLAHLNMVLSISPSKDLGPPSIERFRGFTSHLMHMIKWQKELLASSADHLTTLRKQISHLSSLEKSDCNDIVAPSQDTMRDCIVCLSSVISSSIICLEQLWLYIQACPEPYLLENSENMVALLPSSHTRTIETASYPGLHGLVKGDEGWQRISDDVRILIRTIGQLQSNLDAVAISPCLPITLSQWVVFVQAAHELEKLSDSIEKLNSLTFSDLSSSSDLPCASESLRWVVNEMKSLSTRIICESTKPTLENSSELLGIDSLTKKTSQFEEYSESLLKKVLLIFQAFYKKWYAKDPNKDPKCDIMTEVVVEVKDSVEESQEIPCKATGVDALAKEDIVESHLSKKLNESISSDVQLLQLGDVISTVGQLISELAMLMDGNSSSTQVQHCKRVLLSCLPVLDQLSLLSQYIVTQLTNSHRTSAKLLSVLLGVFSDIAARGFCTPKGLEEDGGDGDGGGKGDGKWEENEGIGLGDMEDGDEKAKEASNKLESEDQLEGAHQEGKEKEENADKDLKEEETGVEMSDDFEGKLQDLGEKDGEGEDGESEEDEDNDADKQMGETGGEGERLDDQIWGSDSEEEDLEEKETDKEGGGMATGEEPELAAKDERAGKADDDDEKESGKEKKQKDINEMEDKGEIDDDQVDPYHGKQDPFPEPEAMDLPDDLQLDDGEAKDKDGNDEDNPFDIDKMKEQIGENMDDENEENAEESTPPNDQKEMEAEGEEEDDDPAGEGLRQEKEKDEGGEDEGGAMEEERTTGAEGGEKEGEEEDEKMREEEVAAPSDDQPSAEPVEALDQVPQDGSKDKTKSVTEHSNKDEGKNADDSKEKHGVGLNQEEQREKGHGGEAEEANLHREKETKENAEKDERKRRRPGESDSTRTLGETKDPVKKKLKTVDVEGKREEKEEGGEEEEADKEEMEEENDGEHGESELYEHIKEAKQKSNELTLDAATKEQTESQPVLNLNEDDADQHDESDEDMVTQEEESVVAEEDVPIIEDSVESAEEKGGEKKKKKETKGKNECEKATEGGAEVEGEVVATQGVARGNETFFHTQILALEHEHEAEMANPEELRLQLQNQLAEWSQPPAGDEALHTWDNFVALTEGLSRDLSEQLRLVLEPTQASRLKGDYRTGRRINMRKVIPYIASEFRKDKIWLRRTKPSKREYQIVLAIDDSSSMADNHSKELAFESLALVSRALALLEAGQLGVLSFGEVVKVLHPLSEPFSEHSGARLLQHFSFDQKKTLIGNLMDTATAMLCGSKTSCTVGVSVAQLLIIVSDGRGVWNEGSDKVKYAVRRAQDSGIFTVFVIVDNPESKDSIMDIRMPIFKDGKMLGITSYLDSFPFPFYLILRDINALPGVLSDALRQWFELVTEMDKH